MSDMMTTTDLVNALDIVPDGEVDKFGIARWRTNSKSAALMLAAQVELLGFSVTTLTPGETWHKMHAVVAWGEVSR